MKYLENLDTVFPESRIQKQYNELYKSQHITDEYIRLQEESIGCLEEIMRLEEVKLTLKTVKEIKIYDSQILKLKQKNNQLRLKLEKLIL